jgi:hypothetical protein
VIKKSCERGGHNPSRAVESEKKMCVCVYTKLYCAIFFLFFFRRQTSYNQRMFWPSQRPILCHSIGYLVLNPMNYKKKSAITERILVNIHRDCYHCFQSTNISYTTGRFTVKAIMLSFSLSSRTYRCSEKHTCCIFQQVLGTIFVPNVMPLNLVIPVSSNFPPTGKF